MLKTIPEGLRVLPAFLLSNLTLINMSDVSYDTHTRMWFKYGDDVSSIQFPNQENFNKDTNITLDDSQCFIPKQSEDPKVPGKINLYEISNEGSELFYKVKSTNGSATTEVATNARAYVQAKPVISEAGSEWPQKMRFAFDPGLIINTYHKDEPISIKWTGLLVGLTVKNTKGYWWLSGKYAKSAHDIKILGIDIVDEMYMEVPIDEKDDASSSISDSLRAHVFISIKGRRTFQVHCVVNRSPLSQAMVNSLK